MPITKDNIKSDISQDKVEVKIDLKSELKDFDSESKIKISKEISEILHAEILNDAAGKSLSSVSGSKFKGLSKAYKAKKKAEGKGTKANLVLEGDMLDNLKASSTVQTIKLKITKSKEKKKFFNHNTGDTVPKRQALPNEGEAFRSGIMKKINKVIKDAKKN